jgi:hypothetical protein
MIKRIFHVGGNVDFDNYYQWMAPWRLLRFGKIVVLPGNRRFERGTWAAIPNEPIRPQPETPADRDHLEELLLPLRAELASRPLYISLDKDVLQEKEAVVNWDSGHLTLAEVCDLLDVFVDAAGGDVAGVDIVGDWSPVRVRGCLPRLMHWTEHPTLTVDAGDAARRNEETNLTILHALRATPVPGRSRLPNGT